MSDESLSFELEASDPSGARAGTVTTRHGSFRTPVFMPVGTLGTVKGLSTDDLEEIASIVAPYENLWIYSDEVYSGLVYDGRFESIAAVPGMQERTIIVDSGSVVPGPGISVATNDFSARGGDQWFSNFGASFTSIGASYQQALSNYVQAADGLNGTISAADYPEGGEGRITQLP